MPLLSCLLAGETVIASGKTYLSTARWLLIPLIFLPPSKPRPKQVGAERHDLSPDSCPLADSERGLSRMTALGSAVSPQARRQARIKRLSRRRHSPSRVHRANSVYRVPNGMSHSWPMARHCMPQKQTHQIALRSAAPVNGGFGPDRSRRVPSAAMAASSASTASTKASTSLKASHEAREVLAGLKAVPICGWSDSCC